MKIAKIATTVLSVIFLMIPGFVFTLQGANILKGKSFMVGDPLWIVIGLALLAAGGAIVYFVNRKWPGAPTPPAA